MELYIVRSLGSADDPILVFSGAFCPIANIRITLVMIVSFGHQNQRAIDSALRPEGIREKFCIMPQTTEGPYIAGSVMVYEISWEKILVCFYLIPFA